MQMYCSQCGLDRTVPNHAADPGACPQCGNTARCSWKPQWSYPLVAPGSYVITGGTLARPQTA